MEDSYDFDCSFDQLLQGLCEDRYLTITDLAELTSIPPAVVASYVDGRTPVSVHHVEALADAFHLKGKWKRLFFEVSGLSLTVQEGRLFHRVLMQALQESGMNPHQLAERATIPYRRLVTLLSGREFPNEYEVFDLAEHLNLDGEFRLMFCHTGGFRSPGEADDTSDTSLTSSANRTSRPLRIFYCHARADRTLRDQLEKHLGVLKRLGYIAEWYDREIQAGTEWEREIQSQIHAAHIILLLISPDFIHSNYCYGIEMRRALELHQIGKACVIPILLRPVDWHGAPFAGLQILPSGAKPVTGSTWRNRDEAFYTVARDIRFLVERYVGISSATSL